MANNKTKVMIVGLDGATFDIIKPWADKGELPTFKKLMKNGVWGPLQSTIPHATVPAWASFATGCNPGKHGFYDFFKEKKNSYDLTIEMFPSKATKKPMLWEILSKAGKKVAVINVPGTYPPQKVNGWVVTGMLTPPNTNFTYPKVFQKELFEKIGPYNVFFKALSSKNPNILLKDLKSTLDTRLKALEYLWNEKKPDFLMMVDNGTDRSEHEFWRFLDTKNPLYDTNETKKYGNPLLEYYKYVDKKLEKILDFIDYNTTLFLMSDHGQGSCRYFVNLNIFLINEGLMKIKKNIFSKIKYHLFKIGFTPKNVYELLRKIGIERYATDQTNIKRRLSVINKIFFSSQDIDWNKTKAFASGVTGAITLNIKNRQPRGCLDFKNDYKKLRNEIIEKLENLRYNNEKIVKKAYKREEIYKGKYLENAPDIIAVPSSYYEFFGMHGFTFNKTVIPTFGNSGSHRPYGIFLSYGYNIKKNFIVNDANILDISPTILKIFNINSYFDNDGKILKKIFK